MSGAERSPATPAVHVYPLDGRPHVLEGTDCWCRPTVEEPQRSPATPRTEAGRRLVARGSNNWSGAGWPETFAADVAECENEAASAARAALAAEEGQ